MSQPLAAMEPTVKGVEFARVDGRSLLFDLYQPSATEQPAPLIIWVHGVAWRAGSRASVPVTSLVENGFAIASVDYRLTPVARFPAQVHDIKGAIRFLRAHAGEYRVDPGRFVIAGASAGGHLAALVGVTNGHEQLEGTVGDHLQTSSDVQGIVSFFGASNLETILSQSTPHGLNVRVPALELLLGGRPENRAELARLASPVAHVDDSDPPLLLIHGDQDPQMPMNQSLELEGAYKRSGRRVELIIVHGGVHGGEGFFDREMLQKVRTFLNNEVLERN